VVTVAGLHTKHLIAHQLTQVVLVLILVVVLTTLVPPPAVKVMTGFFIIVVAIYLVMLLTPLKVDYVPLGSIITMAYVGQISTSLTITLPHIRTMEIAFK
jgi:hypothetical protein